MAKLNKPQKSAAAQLYDKIGSNLIEHAKSDITDKAVVGSIVGLEGYTDSNSNAKRDQVEANYQARINQAFAQEGFGIGNESFTQAQLDAGAMVVMAASNPAAYAHAAMSEDFGNLTNGMVDGPSISSGSYGSSDVGAESIGLEYFQEQALDKHMAASFRFNMQAARQDEFAETIMPTIVADPTETGLLIEIKKTMVHRAVRHAVREKDSRPYNRRNILDAATDHTVLEDQSISVVPYRLEDDSNAHLFISSDLYTPREREVGDYSVMTAPLAFGQRHNLLELSAHPGLVTSGVLDESDELNGRVELDTLYFTVNKAGAPDSDAQLLAVKTANRARSTFNKSQEGDGMEMLLNFTGSTFTISGESRDNEGVAFEALDSLADQDYSLNFTVDVKSSINLQTGIEKPMVSDVEVLSLLDEDGNAIGVKQGAGKVIVDGIVITPVGYVYAATRSNANRRTKGLLIDSTIEWERYKIQLGSPLTSRKPIGREDNSAAVDDLISAAHLRNSALAITKILNVTEVLKEVVRGYGNSNMYEIPSIEGVGRHYVRPWFDEATVNVNNIVSSLDSKDVDANLAATILRIIREQVVRAIQESRFQPALEMLSGYTLSKPQVVIGTDVVIANWIERAGDVRTLGEQFKYTIVTTNDRRFHGRIQWFFKVGEGESGINPLNFGNHLWVPELITDTNLTRNEGTANEITVQPRNQHIVNCPITGVVNVEGIYELVNSRAAMAAVGLGTFAGGGDVVVGDLVPGTGGQDDTNP